MNTDTMSREPRVLTPKRSFFHHQGLDRLSAVRSLIRSSRDRAEETCRSRQSHWGDISERKVEYPASSDEANHRIAQLDSPCCLRCYDPRNHRRGLTNSMSALLVRSEPRFRVAHEVS